MKKVLLFSTLLVALFVTGCGNRKELVCSQSLPNVDVEMTLGYDDDKLSSIEFKEVVDLSSYGDNEIEAIKSQDYCPIAKQSVGELGDALKNCKQNVSGKELVLTGEFDIDKIPNSEEGMKKSMDEAAESLEQQGFKCKK